MAKTKKKPATGPSKKPPKPEKKLRRIVDTDLSSVTGGQQWFDPTNNTFD